METEEKSLRRVRSERNEIEVPIRGPLGGGSLTIHAAETPGQGWKLTKLEAQVQGRAAPIDLLAGAAPVN